MSEIKISVAGPQDAEELLEIYAPYVRDTAVSFEYTVPSPEEFRQRIIHTLEKYPYLKSRKGWGGGRVCLCGPASSKKSCLCLVCGNFYLCKKDKKHLGIGKLLYDTLEKILKEQNILSVNACIAWPEKEDEYLTGDSVRFHEHMGYRKVAEFHKCACKFGRWYNMVWMEKHIGVHSDNPAEIKIFDEVRGMLK